jgi:hypothetical protein
LGEHLISIASIVWLVGNDERSIGFICTDVTGAEIKSNLALIYRVVNAHRHTDAIVLNRYQDE